MARGGGNGAGEKNEKWGTVLSCGEKNDSSERGGEWLKCTIYTPENFNSSL